MAGAQFQQDRGSIRLGFLVGAVLALAGVTAAVAVLTQIHPPAGHSHTFSNFNCDFTIEFNGTDLDDKDTPDPSDDEYIWKYKVTELNGDPGCGLSHWVLELCKLPSPSAFDAYVTSGPSPSFTVDPDPGNTGLSGAKWNDIPDAFVSGNFFLILDENLALDPDVPVAFKTGAGVVTGTIEGPLCNGPVGGIVELSVGGADSPARAADASGATAPTLLAMAGAALALALVAGGWYARRRFRQRRI